MTSGNNPDNLTNKDLGHVSGGGKAPDEKKGKTGASDEKKEPTPIDPDKVISDEFLKEVDGGATAPEYKKKPKSNDPDKDVAPEPGSPLHKDENPEP